MISYVSCFLQAIKSQNFVFQKREMKIRVIFEESRMINVTINTTITFITTIGIWTIVWSQIVFLTAFIRLYTSNRRYFLVSFWHVLIFYVALFSANGILHGKLRDFRSFNSAFGQPVDSCNIFFRKAFFFIRISFS